MKTKSILCLFVLTLMLGTFLCVPVYAGGGAKHTAYGVSQFLAGRVASEPNYAVELDNPTGKTMYAGVLVYQAGRVVNGVLDFTPEFLGCFSAEIPPHLSAGASLHDEDLGGDYPWFVEVISAADDGKVKNGNGLSGYTGWTQGRAPLRLINPKVFKLPEDSGDREDVEECLCEIARDAGNLNLWKKFGLGKCPATPTVRITAGGQHPKLG